MSLKANLLEELKNAMRAGDTSMRDVIRFLLSDIKNVEIDNGEQDDAGVQKIIAKEVKQMRDGIVEYQKGNRADLVEAEEVKIRILETYLPKQMSEEDLKVKLTGVVAQNAGKQFGEVMKAAMAAVGGQADGRRVSEALKSLMA